MIIAPEQAAVIMVQIDERGPSVGLATVQRKRPPESGATRFVIPDLRQSGFILTGVLRPQSVAVSIALVILLSVSPAPAQPALDRVVGRSEFGDSVIIRKVDGQTFGILARAAGVPMGFEGLPPRTKQLSIRATRRTLRDVLNAVVAADARYEWREDDGVIVMRPVDAWNDPASLLNTPVDAVSLHDMAATEIFGVLSRMVGGSGPPGQGLGDTERFSVEIPANSTLLHALNAIVRAHGTLTWAMTPSMTRDASFPTTLSVLIGSTGVGFGIRASAIARSPHMNCCGRITATQDTNEMSPSPAVVTGSLPATGEARFDRIVGPRPDGQPLVAHGVGSVRELAAAARTPMGLEMLPPSEQQKLRRPGFDGVTLTGMTLQNALATLIRLDPRYEWRDLDGVIVFRPVQAWLDASHPLFRLVTPVRLDDVTVSKAIGVVASALGAPEHARNSFPDSRTFSIDLPQGSILDLLNGIARSHGQLYWGWEVHTAEDRKLFSGRRFTVHFSVLGGGGHGFAVP
jgi:hypothetical protein